MLGRDGGHDRRERDAPEVALLVGHDRGEELGIVADVHLAGVGAVAEPEREDVAGEGL